MTHFTFRISLRALKPIQLKVINVYGPCHVFVPRVVLDMRRQGVTQKRVGYLLCLKEQQMQLRTRAVANRHQESAYREDAAQETMETEASSVWGTSMWRRSYQTLSGGGCTTPELEECPVSGRGS